MSAAPLPPFPKPDIWSHVVTVWRDGVECQIDQGPRFTSDQMQAYAQQARADLEAENKRLREALEKITHYAECQVAAFSSGRPSLDMTLFPHLCANARAALKEQP